MFTTALDFQVLRSETEVSKYRKSFMLSTHGSGEKAGSPRKPDLMRFLSARFGSTSALLDFPLSCSPAPPGSPTSHLPPRVQMENKNLLLWAVIGKVVGLGPEQRETMET